MMTLAKSSATLRTRKLHVQVCATMPLSPAEKNGRVQPDEGAWEPMMLVAASIFTAIAFSGRKNGSCTSGGRLASRDAAREAVRRQL